MGVSDILSSIDLEIAQLKQARAILSGISAGAPNGASAAAKSGPVAKARKKRKLSPEGRKRIAAAVTKRWEKYRKAAAK